jgi:hypothetical protein
MKVYETNAALGYNQLAYLIRLDKTPNGYNYLCIGRRGIDDGEKYAIGSVEKDLEDYYVETSKFDMSESPLFGSFLFDFFVERYKNIF